MDAVTLGLPSHEGALLVRRLRGEEQLGRPFRFELELLTDALLEVGEVLRAPAQLTLAGRALTGHVARVALTGREEGWFCYELIFQSRLALLAQRRRRRGFDDANALDLVLGLLEEAGLAAGREVALSPSLAALREQPAAERVSCPQATRIVQSDESDLAFLQRWLEREGLSYSLESHEGRERLRLWEGTDPAASHVRTLRFGGEGEGARLLGLRCERGALPERIELLAPHLGEGMGAQLPLDPRGQGVAIETDRLAATPEELAHQVRLRAQAQIARSLTFTGSSDACMRAGELVSVHDHFDPTLEGALLRVERVEHVLTQDLDLEAGAVRTCAGVSRFRALGANAAYRPARTTPWPEAALDAPRAAKEAAEVERLLEEQRGLTSQLQGQGAAASEALALAGAGYPSPGLGLPTGTTPGADLPPIEEWPPELLEQLDDKLEEIEPPAQTNKELWDDWVAKYQAATFPPSATYERPGVGTLRSNAESVTDGSWTNFEAGATEFQGGFGNAYIVGLGHTTKVYYGDSGSYESGGLNKSKGYWDEVDSYTKVSGDVRDVSIVTGLSHSNTSIVNSVSNTNMASSVSNTNIAASIDNTNIGVAVGNTNVLMDNSISFKGMANDVSATLLSASASMAGLQLSQSVVGMGSNQSLTGCEENMSICGVQNNMNALGFVNDVSLYAFKNTVELGAALNTSLVAAINLSLSAEINIALAAQINMSLAAAINIAIAAELNINLAAKLELNMGSVLEINGVAKSEITLASASTAAISQDMVVKKGLIGLLITMGS